MRKINHLKSAINTIMLLLLILCLGSCGGEKEIFIDMNGIDLEKTVSNEINDMLTTYPNSKVIVAYEQTPVHTSEQVFQNLLEKSVSEKVILYPNLTYKVTYPSSWTEKKSVEAMAYYATKGNKLVGVGLVFSEKVDLTSIKMPAMGYKAKSTNLFQLVTVGFVIVMTAIFVGGLLHMRKKNNPESKQGFGCIIFFIILGALLIWFVTR